MAWVNVFSVGKDNINKILNKLNVLIVVLIISHPGQEKLVVPCAQEATKQHQWVLVHVLCVAKDNMETVLL